MDGTKGPGSFRAYRDNFHHDGFITTANNQAPGGPSGSRANQKEITMTGMRRNSIMVGVDGSAESLTAARWAAREAERRDSALLVVLAISEPPYLHEGYVFPGPVIEASRKVNRERLDRAAQDVRAEFPGLVLETALDTADPRRALTDRSSEVIMTVVGTRGHGRLPEVMVGSVALFVAAHAHSPVVVVPPKTDLTRELSPGPVLLGVDGHPTSVAAIGFAFEEAAARRVSLLAALVFDDLAYRGFAKGANLIGRMDDDEERAVLAEQLAGWAEKYPDVPVSKFVLRGRPASTLLRCAGDGTAEQRPGMIVLGTRGRGGLAGLVLGSTSQRLMTQAQVPVVVVRPENEH